MSLEDLARLTGLHRNTLSGSPGSPKVQAKLGEIATILMRAEALTGEQGRAILWFRHQPLAGFDGQTAEQLVAGGYAEAVMRHLDLIEDGVAA